MPIPECWRRTRNSFLYHNLLTCLGNLALGIPVYILATGRQLFNEGVDWAFLEYADNGGFDGGGAPPLQTWAEQSDRKFSYILFLSTVIPATLSQPMLIGLGFLYFKKFHPWSCILNGELTIS